MARNPNREQVFRFKQFEVRNAASAMKVGTDGVLLGAWMPLPIGATVLDVGAGCGLIALMAAQRGASNVVGVEIDSAAAQEASENIGSSPWGDRVKIINGDFFDVSRQFIADARCFDVIVSNPPFFTGGIYSPNDSRLKARHGITLDFPDLIATSANLLSDDGHLALVSPIDRKADIELAVALSRLNVCRLCNVATKQGVSPIRLLWDISHRHSACVTEHITINSPEYRTLTASFYLDRP